LKTAIIGAGVTGAFLSQEFPDAVVYEKSDKPGGRASQNSFSTGELYDIGATVVKKQIEYIQNGSTINFDMLDFFNNRSDLQFLPIKTRQNTYYLSKGMSSICNTLLKNSDVKTNHSLESMQRKDDSWIINFSNGHSAVFDQVILTLPVSQSLACLKNSGLISYWEEFSRKHSDYRSCLVSTGVWDVDAQTLEQTRNFHYTNYFKNEDAEYFSIESNKYGYHSFVLSIQFSSGFSSRNLERWIGDDGVATSVAEKVSRYYFKEVFSSLGLNQIDPDFPKEMRVKKWRYSIIENPILDKDFLNFDHPKVSEMIALSQKYNVWLLGDWIWGSRIVNSALSVNFFVNKIKAL
jgi:predicted NAD/FAD-dependent oxidoreductase